MDPIKLSDIARRIGGDLEATDDPEITGVSGIREAQPGQISFLAHPRYAAYLETTAATALIVGRDFPVLPGRPVIRVDDPYLGFLKVLTLFGGDRPSRPPGVHPTAVVAPDAVLGADVTLEAHVVVEGGARIGRGAILMPGVFVGACAELGEESFLYPGVVIREGCRLGRRVVVHANSVIGADGFGYVRDAHRHLKVPQVGTVEIGDDVEIGANVTIDRATTGVTRIGEGVKIDNLVQIAHNVTIGDHTIVCAQVGISGSTEIGRDVTLAGQAGVTGHIKIGDRVMVGGQAGVTKSVPADARVSGYPAAEHEQALRLQAHTRRLPELSQLVRELRARLDLVERELEKEREKVL